MPSIEELNQYRERISAENGLENVVTPTRRRFIQMMGAAFMMPELLRKPEEHWRLESPHGPVHVWHPGLADKPEETVIYAHGDNNNADRVWGPKYEIKDQFKRGGREALHIVPSLPTGFRPKGTTINWDKNLKGLTDMIEDEIGMVVNDKLTIVGHSAGYRAIQSWLDDERINDIVLIDSFYGYFGKFKEWLEKEGNRLMLISADPEKSQSTKKWAKLFAKRLSKQHSVQFSEGMPESLRGENTKLVYVDTPFHHHYMPMGNRVIPQALRLFGEPKIIG